MQKIQIPSWGQAVLLEAYNNSSWTALGQPSRKKMARASAMDDVSCPAKSKLSKRSRICSFERLFQSPSEKIVLLYACILLAQLLNPLFHFPLYYSENGSTRLQGNSKNTQ
uniref:Uncharacterized protein n=1 Tax=Oryza nivara TaxID=4536 RepID=A0A0E0GEK8_ORYNI